jgi:hypothetical protein
MGYALLEVRQPEFPRNLVGPMCSTIVTLLRTWFSDVVQRIMIEFEIGVLTAVRM